MKNKLIVGSILLAAVIVINSCENKQAVAPLNNNLPGSCDTAKLTFSSDSNSMQAIINVQCGAANTQCHSSNSISGYDYTSYYGIYSNYQNGLLYGALFGNLPPMPKVAQPGWDPTCMLPKFKAWMNRGCPQ
jgi:hypothetical protein